MISGKLIPLIFGACALLIAGSMFLMMEIADRTVAANAERTSMAWADFMSSRLADIEGTVSDRDLTGAGDKFLEHMRHFANVFRFKIFDGTGRLIFASDDLAGNAEPVYLETDHPEAVGALSGEAYTVVQDGTERPDRPDVYVESYVPVMRDGRILAIVEVDVDQTEAAAALRGRFLFFGLWIVGLTLLAISIPAVWKPFEGGQVASAWGRRPASVAPDSRCGLKSLYFVGFDCESRSGDLSGRRGFRRQGATDGAEWRSCPADPAPGRRLPGAGPDRPMDHPARGTA